MWQDLKNSQERDSKLCVTMFISVTRFPFLQPFQASRSEGLGRFNLEATGVVALQVRECADDTQTVHPASHR